MISPREGMARRNADEKIGDQRIETGPRHFGHGVGEHSSASIRRRTFVGVAFHAWPSAVAVATENRPATFARSGFPVA